MTDWITGGRFTQASNTVGSTLGSRISTENTVNESLTTVNHNSTVGDTFFGGAIPEAALFTAQGAMADFENRAAEHHGDFVFAQALRDAGLNHIADDVENNILAQIDPELSI